MLFVGYVQVNLEYIASSRLAAPALLRSLPFLLGPVMYETTSIY